MKYKKQFTKNLISFLFITMLLTPALYAGEVTTEDNPFGEGETLTADKLNIQFNEVKAAVNDSDASMEEIEALVAHLRLQAVQRRHFLDAGRAPSGPKVQQDDTTPEIAQTCALLIRPEELVSRRGKQLGAEDHIAHVTAKSGCILVPGSGQRPR